MHRRTPYRSWARHLSNAERDGPLRVLRIITRLNVGGPSYQAIFLTERLRGPEFESRLLVGSVGPNEGSMEDLAAERKVAFTRVAGLGREISFKSDGATLLRLYREIRRFRPHLVHTHLAKAGTLGRIAARMARVPVVIHTYHGHVFHGYFSPRKTAMFLRIERALARWTDRIIVLGEAQEREILGFGVGRPEQMVRIPLGLELEPFLELEEGRRQQAEDPATVGIVARLVPIKAHDLFLRAARMVADRRPHTRFRIIGDGDERPGLERQARELGFDDSSSPHPHNPTPDSDSPTPNAPRPTPSVTFTGFRSDLPAVYSELDVVVLCSRNEGLPVTLIEALAAARPVVSTEVGAVRDLVTPGETGLLVPSGDPDALAAAILRHLEQPEAAAEMGHRGRAHIHPRFSIDRLEGDIRALYRELGARDWGG